MSRREWSAFVVFACFVGFALAVVAAWKLNGCCPAPWGTP